MMSHLLGFGHHQEACGLEDRMNIYREKIEAAEYEEVRWRPTPERGTKRKHPSAAPTAASSAAAAPSAAADGTDGRVSIARWRNSGSGLWRAARAALPDAAGDTTMPAPRHAATTQVTMSVTELKALADTLHRASKSAQALGRVCGGASQACADEKVVIDEARDAMRARIEGAGFQWSPPS